MSEYQRKNERTEFQLSEPVQDVGGEWLYSLHLRRPKAKDLRVLDKHEGEIAGMYAIISRLAGITEEQIDLLELSDLTPMIDWVSSFLPAGQVVNGS